MSLSIAPARSELLHVCTVSNLLLVSPDSFLVLSADFPLISLLLFWFFSRFKELLRILVYFECWFQSVRFNVSSIESSENELNVRIKNSWSGYAGLFTVCRSCGYCSVALCWPFLANSWNIDVRLTPWTTNYKHYNDLSFFVNCQLKIKFKQ